MSASTFSGFLFHCNKNILTNKVINLNYTPLWSIAIITNRSIIYFWMRIQYGKKNVMQVNYKANYMIMITSEKWTTRPCKLYLHAVRHRPRTSWCMSLAGRAMARGARCSPLSPRWWTRVFFIFALLTRKSIVYLFAWKAQLLSYKQFLVRQLQIFVYSLCASSL